MSGTTVHSANWRGYRHWAHAIQSQRAAAKKPQLMALPRISRSVARLKP
ncbi:MAG TPA: hypothetical protein VM686_33685 [Polyangiaceae bacterium]|jgi:hypothetical protein|nr:hypothetical protein [Polyangiaceae bacterium]